MDGCITRHEDMDGEKMGRQMERLQKNGWTKKVGGQKERRNGEMDG